MRIAPAVAQAVAVDDQLLLAQRAHAAEHDDQSGGKNAGAARRHAWQRLTRGAVHGGDALKQAGNFGDAAVSAMD